MRAAGENGNDLKHVRSLYIEREQGGRQRGFGFIVIGLAVFCLVETLCGSRKNKGEMVKICL